MLVCEMQGFEKKIIKNYGNTKRPEICYNGIKMIAECEKCIDALDKTILGWLAPSDMLLYLVSPNQQI